MPKNYNMHLPVIELKKVSKSFLIPHERMNTLRERFIHLFRPRTYESFGVLSDISLVVQPGEFLGVIGDNGSGKSTFLKVLSGVLKPDSGEVKVRGVVSPFLELGLGFQPDLSGRENMFLYGALLGLSRKDIHRKYQEIVAFAELERFIDQKIKNYSSGMQVRLAFAITIQAQADIFLVDEVLAVGDYKFQEKCFEVFRRFKQEKKTVIFVSHDLEKVEQFCERSVLLKDGQLVQSGRTDEVVSYYKNQKRNGVDSVEKEGEVSISEVTLLDRDGQVCSIFHPNDSMTITFGYQTSQEFDGVIFQVHMYTEGGWLCAGDNTDRHGLIQQKVSGRGIGRIRYEAINLLAGRYTVFVKIWPAGFSGPCFESRPVSFSVESRPEEGGAICYMPARWEIRSKNEK